MSFDRSLVDVVDMLTALGVANVKQVSDEVEYSCPFPGHSFGDTHPSASMNVDSTVFHCFGCKASGDAVSFLALHEGVSPMQAVRWLRERYDPGEAGGSATAMLERIIGSGGPKVLAPPLAELPQVVEGVTAIDWVQVAAALGSNIAVPDALNYPFLRGFNVRTLENFGWGYDQITNRLTFEVRDDEGRLVGLKARAWWDGAPNKYIAIGDTPKSGIVRGFPPFMSRRVLFNMHQAKHDALKGFELVVVEGELNAMMLRQIAWATWAGEPPVVGLPGSSLSHEQALLIRRYADRCVLFFDSDDAGEIGAADAAEQLKPYMPVRVVGPHEGDACSLTGGECLSLIMEAPSAISLPT